ncbi:uncharacterized protein L203_102377 [Cryptococcus depauperatus CBS 7841]|uniref:Cation efflux protein transmembrane domain-containing protein n=1 Tax=Cryptococcus depauperatus CBS 7841 TaxID=1295531 RepID=A0AAJ8JRK0_9TREE
MQPPSTPVSSSRSPFPAARWAGQSTSSRTMRMNRSPSNTFLRLFVGALALAVSKSWVLDNKDQEGGDVGWLILAFWGGRLLGEVRRVWGQRRQQASMKQHTEGKQGCIPSSVNFAAQTLFFFLSLQRLGPLRNLAAVWKFSNPRLLGTLWPTIIATFYVLAQELLAGNVTSFFIILGLITTTIVAEYYSLATPKQSSENGLTPHYRQSLWNVAISASVASVFVLCLSALGSIPAFVPTSPYLFQRFGSFITAFFVHYIPFTFSSRPSSSGSLHLKTLTDRITFLLAIPLLQIFAFHPFPSYADMLLLIPLTLASVWASLAPKAQAEMTSWYFPSQTISTSRPSWSLLSFLPARWRPHLQTIITTPTSSRIFYFLLLNLGYMGIQMAYGVFTNSLGLISDSIHMLFDCLGLGVGLWASVATTWKPDGRYTFGYSRVETLSGFANGCFLILISVFIIFEGIQRVFDPPEMKTHRLLLVSGIGLAINLWGMYATGGHHHHGHSHGHGHEHGHSHSHTPAPTTRLEARYEHDTLHDPSITCQDSPQSILQEHKLPARLDNSSIVIPVVARKHIDPHKSKHEHGHRETSDNVHPDQCHKHDSDHSSHISAHDHDHRYHDHECDSRTHDHSHNHGHGHDHAHSHNMRGVFLHVLADTLGSVGVIISTLLIRITGWTGFDPIASLFIAALIMASVIPLVIDSGRILCLDVGDDKESEIRAALAELSSVDGLANYAAPRFWPRCEGELVGSIHIHLAPSPSSFDPSRHVTPPHISLRAKTGETIYVNAEKIVARVEKILKKRIRGLTELVVQIEGSEEKSFCACMTGGGT